MKKAFLISLIFASILFSGCFAEKNTPFYDSQWIMQNYDAEGQLYYHHLILEPGHSVMLRVSYADSTSIIVWKGKYKINSKKIVFDFTECQRYEDGKLAGNYTDAKLINYYKGDFYYSVAELGETRDTMRYHLQLIRPQNYFYGENVDIFGNPLEEFVKVNKEEITD
jgi:hypothetical protein